MKIDLRALALVLLAHVSYAGTSSVPPSVEEAYRAIPHQRTVFDPLAAEKAGMRADESKALDRLFALVDQAIVAKVDSQRRIQAGTEASPAYGQIRKAVREVKIPAKLENFRKLVEAVVDEHARYFEELRTQGTQKAAGLHPLIQSSSQKLHQAYGDLLNLFPEQQGRNRQAFFDYLCALDFI